jgi:hypothetical protein
MRFWKSSNVHVHHVYAKIYAKYAKICKSMQIICIFFENIYFFFAKSMIFLGEIFFKQANLLSNTKNHFMNMILGETKLSVVAAAAAASMSDKLSIPCTAHLTQPECHTKALLSRRIPTYVTV